MPIATSWWPGAYGIEGGSQAMDELLAGPRLPTAVVAEYDELAIGALRSLRRAGIPVPGGISVVGIDDHEVASVVDLTTVGQPMQEEGGSTAAQLLPDTLGERLLEPMDVVLPTRLIVRGVRVRRGLRRRSFYRDGIRHAAFNP